MMRRVGTEEQAELLAFLRHDEPVNLPMIGDVLRHGLDTDFLEFWAQTDEAGRWLAIVRRFFEHYIVFVPALEAVVPTGDENPETAEADICGDAYTETVAAAICGDAYAETVAAAICGDAYAETVAADICGDANLEELEAFLIFSGPASVSGRKQDLAALLRGATGTWTEAVSMMLPGDAFLAPASVSTQDGSQGRLDRAGLEDAGTLGHIIFDTEAFRHNYRSAEEVAAGIAGRMRSGGVRHLVVRVGERIVAHANTTAETEGYALISGVVTIPEAQRKGHGIRLVSALCRELLAEGRIPCLFAKSPAALAMYRRLGFVETGRYMTWRLAS